MIWLVFTLPILTAITRIPQPTPLSSKFDQSWKSLNDFIPKLTTASDFIRLLTMDCSENFISSKSIVQLLDSVKPDIATFIKYPRSSSDLDSIRRLLSSRSYGALWVKPYGSEKGEILVISKFPLEEHDQILHGEDKEFVGADVKVKIGKKNFHVLTMNLDKYDSGKRLAGAMEVLYRAGAAISRQEHYAILGSTNSKSIADTAYSKLYYNSLLKSPFDALKWSRPRIIDVNNQESASDQIFIGHNIASHVRGAYVYYTDISPHLPLIVDISKAAFGISTGISDEGYSWNKFSSDLYHLTIFWVPIVAAGTIFVIILGILLGRREKEKNINSSDHATESAIWDTIDVSEKGTGKERQATYDSISSSTSSVYPPTVVRIQTPPTYPPPPYTVVPKSS